MAMDICLDLTDEQGVLLWLAVNCEGEQFLVSLGVLQSEGTSEGRQWAVPPPLACIRSWRRH
jgi:hypothetical protein